MIFRAGRNWSIQFGWEWCIVACLASAITFLNGCATPTDPMGTVPKVVGLTQAAATSAITGAKLTVGTITQQASNAVPFGNVISQDPASGSTVAQGSPVNLVISSGRQTATVPNVVGLTQAAAASAIDLSPQVQDILTRFLSGAG
jgi:beta-lactam-binding protein with PASTA domain